ncbi:hypothetical protein BFJ69_g15824 [Fusarium oxysporum]|uniref:chitinase n=1 Tax=Fusarium oxysporum TaxID=5507 RepID=A0A420MCZ6_FUSOX|nr:hypothetical protein BFJ69_g15824 [Fusarium oxysporum]
MWWPTTGSKLGLLLLLPTLTIALTPVQRIERNARPCPGPCDSGSGTAQWSIYMTVGQLAVCAEPLLLAYGLYTDLHDPKTDQTVWACTLGNADTKLNFLAESGYLDPDAKKNNFGFIERRAISSNSSCGTGPAKDTKATAKLSSWKSDKQPISKDPVADVILAAESLKDYVQKKPVNCEEKSILLTYVRGTVVGLYSGSHIHTVKTLSSVLAALKDEYKSGSTDRIAIDICQGRTASDLIGVVADPAGDLASVQAIMRSWNEGQCANGYESGNSKLIGDILVSSHNTSPVLERRNIKFRNRRAECQTVTVDGGDTCETLAKYCGVSVGAFKGFNTDTQDLCNTLGAGQRVCCSAGTLPNVRAKILASGVCTSYDVKEGDTCDGIAQSYGITKGDLMNFNKKTWAWNGCGNNLQPFTRICVSEGSPPMPGSVWNAECGPTVNDTKPPSDGQELADLNPCPLNVCCNRWGHCGLTNDFCGKSKSETGNPGTGQPGEGGCISNCERKLVNNDKGPAQYRKIGYFEGWNYNRPCLNMHVLDIDKSYTHIHFSFGEISHNLDVVIPEATKTQFQAFVEASDFPAKKILAFGGWAFSNEGTGTGLFRKAVSPGNRQAFADRVVRFAIDNRLDGLDFDWEYPGATDIEGSDPGQKDDGDNYYEFLKLVREKLPKDKSVSIAAPASYWYLKGFPIEKIAKILDYIVFMTYDLHGQWDVGSKWAMPGCEAGNCLRSHVNSTETMDALIMVTKAGVPSHKVVVGVSSYGRSFKMSDSTCRGPQCTFLGARNESPANKGRCTDTGGYISDFEINEIIKKGGAIKSWYDEETDSDYLVYKGTEWVAYMSNTTKSRRMGDYMKLNFGGTSDWAIDLQGDFEKRDNPSARAVYLDPQVYETQQAKCEPPCILVFPPSVLPDETTIGIGKYTTSLEYGASGRTTIDGKETTAFITKTYTITVDVPAITTKSMMYSNVNITKAQENTELLLKPSIKVPPITVEVPNGEGDTTTRIITLPPWPAITRQPSQSGDESDTEPTSTEDTGSIPDPTEILVPAPPDVDNATTTISGLPVYTDWPPVVIEPIEKEVEEPEEDDDGFITTCHLWFFSFCFGKVKGLKWKIGPGIYPPVGLDKKPVFPEKPSCEPESTSLCWTTTSLSPTVIGPVTSTITNVDSECETIHGCHLTGWETELTKTGSCTLPTKTPKRRNLDSGTVPGILKNQASSTDDENCEEGFVVLPKSIHNPGTIHDLLKDLPGSKAVTATSADEENPKTLYVLWWVPKMPSDVRKNLKMLPELAIMIPHDVPNTTGSKRDAASNETDSDITVSQHESKREIKVPRDSDSWAPSQVSLPKGAKWKDPGRDEYKADRRPNYRVFSRQELGQNQYIYVVGEFGVNLNHFEYSDLRQDSLNVALDGLPSYGSESSNDQHGTGVASAAVGRTLGLSPGSTLVLANTKQVSGMYAKLAAVAAALESIVKSDRMGNSVVSMSWAVENTNTNNIGESTSAVIRLLYQLLAEIDKTNTVIVAAAGNYYPKRPDYPARFGATKPTLDLGSLPNLIVVGATNDRGLQWRLSQHDISDPYVNIFAPGEKMPVAEGGGREYRTASGTSYAAPMVAGLVAYLRSLPSSWDDQLHQPANVKKLIRAISRKIVLQSGAALPRGKEVIWNGQDGSRSCFDKGSSLEACPEIPPVLAPWPGNPGGGGGSDGPTKSIDWKQGEDGPKCKASGPGGGPRRRAEGTCGGELCQGYYCQSNPKGPPPDFRDPKDPNHDGNGPPAGPIENPPKPDNPDWGVQWMDRTCTKPLAAPGSDKGMQACTPNNMKSVYKATGFTKNGYQACFYYNDKCEATDSKDWASFSGGSGWDSAASCVDSDDREFKAFRITSGKCSSEVTIWWLVNFSTDCGPYLIHNEGTEEIECSNKVPIKNGNTAMGALLGDDRLKMCFYTNRKCQATEATADKDLVPWKNEQCVYAKEGQFILSYKVTRGSCYSN